MRWVVIMAGGSGERFWPLSRRVLPKQLLKIVGGTTLIQQAFRRSRMLCPAERILVITGRTIEKEILRQLKGIPRENIISEPVGRDTAPCIALASFIALSRDRDATLAVFPADHVIGNTAAFRRVLGSCYDAAGRGFLVTIGIKPDFPSTAYGYIEKGPPVKGPHRGIRFFKAARFHEKPERKKAQRFFRAGRFYWNSGIFVWRAEEFLKNLRTHARQIYDGIGKMQKHVGAGRAFYSHLNRIYPSLPKISVDYAVMEKAGDTVITVAENLKWDDIGSWSSLSRHYPSDRRDNVSIGRALFLDSGNCIVFNRSVEKEGLCAAVGVKDLIIIQTKDAVLVCDRSKDQDIKKLLQVIDSQKELGKDFR